MNKEKLQAFKAQVREKFPEHEQSMIIKNDYCLQIWLDDSNGDAGKALGKLGKVLEERLIKEIDKINESTKVPAIVEKEVYMEYLGKDLKGNLVFFFPMGKCDSKKIVDELGYKEEFLLQLIKLFELNLKKCIDEGKSFVIITDMSGFSFRQLTSMALNDIYLKVTRYFEFHTSFVADTFLINAPKVWTMLFALLKPLLSQNSLNKLHVFGSDENKWRKALIKKLPEEILPKKTELSTNNIKYDDELQEFVEVSVGAGQKLNIEFDVEDPNVTMSWSFKTEHYDIGFSLLFNDDEVCLESKRINSHLEPQFGSHLCQKLGKYTLVFDNSYSHVRSKNLHYMVNFTGEESDDEDTAL